MKTIWYRCSKWHEFPVDVDRDTHAVDIACECGAEATWFRISYGEDQGHTSPQVLVKNKEIEWDKSKNVDSFGRSHGRSDRQQFEGHRKTIELQRKLVAQQNRSCSKKDGFEFLGCAPMEAVHSYNRNVGESEAAQKDPVSFYKRLGTYMGGK